MAAGVHRIVTRWVNHHPAFIAEMNQIRSDASVSAAAAVERVTRAALEVVEQAMSEGNVDAALRWLRLVTLRDITALHDGPTDSRVIVDAVRQRLPTSLMKMFDDLDDPTTRDAESAIAQRLDP